MLFSRLLTLSVFFSLIITLANADVLSKDQIENIKDEAISMSSINVNETSSGGEFTGCELVFQSVFRDQRNSEGDIVKTFGSIYVPYYPKKAFGVMLKLRAIDFKLFPSGEYSETVFQPYFAELIYNENLKPFLGHERKCEKDGICKIYFDKDNKLLSLIHSEQNIKIIFNRAKGGFDYPIDISEIGNKDGASINEMNKFSQCLYKRLLVSEAELKKSLEADKSNKNK